MTTNQMSSVINLVNSEANRLGSFLAGLNESAWSQDSACVGWKVGEVVAHLTVATDTWTGSINRALSGDAAPPPGQSFLAPGDIGSQTVGQAAVSKFEEVGLKLLEDYTNGYTNLAQILGNLSAEDWDKPCFHRRGAMPIRDFVGLRVQELTVHGWDIRAGLEPSANVSEEPLTEMVRIVPRWLGYAFRKGLGLPTPARFRFQTTGAVAVNQDVVVDHDAFQVESSGTGNADATFRGATGNYILLIYGRLSVEQALATGRLSIEGSQERAVDFTRWFQGF